MPAGRAFSAGGESDIIGISHGRREKRAEKEKWMDALMEWTNDRVQREKYPGVSGGRIGKDGGAYRADNKTGHR